MKIYIVRHGQSEGNAAGLHQTADSPLSQLGVGQAEFIADRFSQIPLDKILSSTHQRAHHTASIIASKCNMEVETTSLLREIKRPSSVEGLPITSPTAKKIRSQVFANFKTHHHFEDEENFHDLRHRVDQVIQMLDGRRPESWLLVSHGITIKMLVGRLVFGKLLTPKLFVRMIETWRTENTGITVCQWQHRKWNLEVWNDSAHLGEV